MWKRLGLPLESEKSDGERHYRIVARKAPRSGAEDGPSFRKMATMMPMTDAAERIRYTRCASVRGEAIPEKAVECFLKQTEMRTRAEDGEHHAA